MIHSVLILLISKAERGAGRGWVGGGGGGEGELNSLNSSYLP